MNSDGALGTVVFDVLGTLIDLEGLRPALIEAGAPPHTFELWFAESLRDYFSISHSGTYARLSDVLRSGLARHPIGNRHTVMKAFGNLGPVPSARDACRMIDDRGFRIIALTNGSEDLTRSLLTNGGLLEYFDRIISCDSIKISKPHPSVYALAREAAQDPVWMVASHAWDVAGAGRAGFRTVLVYPEPEQFPDVFSAPDVIAPDLVAAARSILAT